MLRKDHLGNASMGVVRSWLSCGLCSLILLTLGCLSGGRTQKTSSLKVTKNVKSSVPELSSRNQSLLAVYSAEIEVAADKIIMDSHSPATRRQALIWKAEAIPVIQMCLLNTDPVAAVLDSWAFIFQMSEYIERPVVKQTLGESYPVIADTLKNMEAEMERRVLWAAPKANIADLRRIVGTWARAHPIQDSLAGRQSAEPDMIRRASQSELGTTGSIKTLAEGVGDLTARLDTYNLYLPKQARWQQNSCLAMSPVIHK